MTDTISAVSNFSPRLVRLLGLILRSGEPVSIDTVSQSLKTSRRTVFRELKNAELVLSEAGCAFVSVPAKGIVFSGDDDTRKKILDALVSYNPQPVSKRERLLRLLIELVANAGNMQKLLYYASAFDVSESTISHDLDDLEPWLADQGLSLMRKGGIGVQCDGTEEKLRTALVSRLMLDGDTEGRSYTAVFDFPGDDIESGVLEILRRKAKAIDWMTSESFSLIAVYLMVAVERVYDGKVIAAEQPQAAGFQITLAEELAAEISEHFGLKLLPTERLAIAGWIQSCRSKQDSPLGPWPADQHSLVNDLTLRMIDRFDPPIAAILKTNDQLTKLLSRHLLSALPRLKSGKLLPNPLEGELVKNYPEVYEKTCAAVKVLEEYLGIAVPSNEVSFIQIHFLAALAYLGDRNVKRRLLRAGVVCVSGIGTSYMLAYQVRKRFKGELDVEVADYADRSSLAALDLIISTIPIEETKKPFVLVQTVLGENDFEKIQKAVNAIAFGERKEEQPQRSLSLEKQLDRKIELYMQSRKLLNNFSVESITANCSFNELVRFAATRFAPENPEAVGDAILEREATSSQVVFELGIVLLHTRGEYVKAPVFAVIVPEGGVFTGEYFKRAKSCVIMLLPKNTPTQMRDLLGSLSGALIERPHFLDAVRSGDRAAIRAVLEREISEMLSDSGGETKIQKRGERP